MVVFLIGIVCLVVGIVLLAFGGPHHAWWWSFVTVLKGSIPPILILIGLAAAAVGISSIRDKAAAGAQDEPKPTPPEKKA